VLRNRLQQFERDNTKLQNELAMAKEQGPQNDKTRQLKSDAQRLQSELQYAKQDLTNSEDERRRLQGSLQAAKVELEALKRMPQDVEMAAPMAARAPTCACAYIGANTSACSSAAISHTASARLIGPDDRVMHSSDAWCASDTRNVCADAGTQSTGAGADSSGSHCGGASPRGRTVETRSAVAGARLLGGSGTGPRGIGTGGMVCASRFGVPNLPCAPRGDASGGPAVYAQRHSRQGARSPES